MLLDAKQRRDLACSLSVRGNLKDHQWFDCAVNLIVVAVERDVWIVELSAGRIQQGNAVSSIWYAIQSEEANGQLCCVFRELALRRGCWCNACVVSLSMKQA